MAKQQSKTAKSAKNHAQAKQSTNKLAPTPAIKGKPAPDWPVLSLVGLGILITLYLSFVKFSTTPTLLCGEGSGCDQIQQSAWSTFIGIPLAIWGLLFYVAIGLVAWLMKLGQKRWQYLWILTFAGVVFSLFLTIAGKIYLNALCPWCIASLLTLTALLLVLSLKRPLSMDPSKQASWLPSSLKGLALSLVMILIVQADNMKVPNSANNEKLAALAEHLQQSGALYYGAHWCPACQQQKQLFGNAGDDLPYVECSSGGRGSPMTQACVDAAIQSFPTWIYNSQRFEGTRQPEDLARLTGFAW